MFGLSHHYFQGETMQRLVHSASRRLIFLIKTEKTNPAIVGSFPSVTKLNTKRTYSTSIVNRKLCVDKKSSTFVKELANRTQIYGSKSFFEQKNYLFIRNTSNVSIYIIGAILGNLKIM